MSSVHARPLQAPKGLDPEGDEVKTDREQSDLFRGVRDTGALRPKRRKPQMHALPHPRAPSRTDVNLLSLTTGSDESTGSDYPVPLPVPSASVPANGGSLSLSGVVRNK